MSKKKKRVIESDSSFDFEESDTDIDSDYTLDDDTEELSKNTYNLRNTNMINYNDDFHDSNNSFIIKENDCKLMQKIKKKSMKKEFVKMIY